MRKAVGIGLVMGLCLCVGCATTQGEQNSKVGNGSGVSIEKRADADILDVVIDGEHFTSFNYSPEYKKPFLWPVLGEGEVTVTRNWPMGEVEDTDDHVHQKSMWSAYGDVNGIDWWGEGGNSGSQRVVNVTSESGKDVGWIRAETVWQDKDGNAVLNEEREYRFLRTPANARLFDYTITVTPAAGDALFGDTKEGGMLSLRIRDIIREKRGGTITNAEGMTTEDQCWGKPSAWCDYSGAIEVAGVRGVTIFGHPSNLRHPTRWHVRGYGLMAANCFGLSHFVGDGANGDYTLKSGEKLTFHYGVYVHSGDAAQAGVADQYKKYVARVK